MNKKGTIPGTKKRRKAHNLCCHDYTRHDAKYVYYCKETEIKIEIMNTIENFSGLKNIPILKK